VHTLVHYACGHAQNGPCNLPVLTEFGSGSGIWAAPLPSTIYIYTINHISSIQMSIVHKAP
jgi:hypothetical protein